MSIEDDWPSDKHLALPAYKSEANEDYKKFDPAILKQIETYKDDSDRVNNSSLELQRDVVQPSW